MKSILIVEDNEWLAEQYARVLKLAGFKTTIALHALGAINAVDDINPDAIILDLLLTGSTAFALLHELQSYGDTGNIPIILCTSLASELAFDDLKPYGIKCILDKSTMAPDDLITELNRIFI